MERINHRVEPAARDPTGVGGWLLVLCVSLLVWQPIGLASIASWAVGQIGFRGPSLAVALAGRVLVTAFGIAAGIALADRRAGAVSLAKASLIASAAADVVMR